MQEVIFDPNRPYPLVSKVEKSTKRGLNEKVAKKGQKRGFFGGPGGSGGGSKKGPKKAKKGQKKGFFGVTLF